MLTAFVPSYGCHPREPYREPKPKLGWRRLFDECGRCRGARVPVTWGEVAFFLCPPCVERLRQEWATMR